MGNWGSDEVASTLDACGLMCPEPVMLLHKAVRNLQSGQIVKVLATDPSTMRDIPKFCQFLGHSLLSQTEEGGQFIFFIKKRAGAQP